MASQPLYHKASDSRAQNPNNLNGHFLDFSRTANSRLWYTDGTGNQLS